MTGAVRKSCMRLTAVLALLMSALAAHAAQPVVAGSAYPLRPIRLVTSTPVGSGSDIVARVLTPKLTEMLGQQIVVDNRSGASGLIAAELVARAAPDGYTYKGSMAAMTEVMGGQMHSTCTAAPSLSLISSGQKVRVLGVTTRGATPLTPGIVPVADTLPGYELLGWYGMLAPPGTSKELVTWLNQEITRLVSMPEVRDRMLAVGAEPTPSTPAEFGVFLQKETARWGKLLKEAGVKAQ